MSMVISRGHECRTRVATVFESQRSLCEPRHIADGVLGGTRDVSQVVLASGRRHRNAACAGGQVGEAAVVRALLRLGNTAGARRGLSGPVVLLL